MSFLKTGLTIPDLRMLGNSLKLENEFKNLARIGDIICEQRLSIIMGISLALLADNSFIISLISSGEESARKILDSTEFFI